MPYGRVRLARFTCEDHAYGASRLPKMEENDCFAVYLATLHLRCLPCYLVTLQSLSFSIFLSGYPDKWIRGVGKSLSFFRAGKYISECIRGYAVCNIKAKSLRECLGLTTETSA